MGTRGPTLVARLFFAHYAPRLTPAAAPPVGADGWFAPATPPEDREPPGG